jgi:hypothetical protein
MVIFAVAHRGWPRLYSIVTLVVMLGFGLASAVAIQGIEENDTRWGEPSSGPTRTR